MPPPLDLSPNPTNRDAGLAQLLLTVVELVRQLMEAQVIRRMEAGNLSEAEIDRAAESLRQLEAQVLQLCEVFDIDPAELNIDLGEIGSLLPRSEYYPGESSENASILELLDRLLDTGIVVDGDVDVGLTDINLIHLRLRLLLTSQLLPRS